ncbi:MAG: glycosyltransferase family 2 protein [Candidatus Aenigmarchaeota archaeon]|nr:glycosyltransferase family 2 protein [Candidatus Aenigmarchaeota archaeon]
MEKEKISIVIPTLNEEKNLKIVLPQLVKFMNDRGFRYEIIIVDGYSEDKTVDVTKKFGAVILFDNKGKGSAIRKGLKWAKGDIIVTMDADCSHSINEIGLLIEGIRTGYDICMGSRFIQGGGTNDMPLIRKIGNKFFVFLVNFFWGMRYSDLCYGYRSFRRSVVRRIDLRRDGFGIETEISIQAAKKHLKVLEVPSFEKARKYGKGKLRSIRDGFNILKTILMELFRG